MYKVFLQSEHFSIVRMHAIYGGARELLFHAKQILNADKLNPETLGSIETFIDSLDMIASCQFKLRRQLQKVLDDNKVD